MLIYAYLSTVVFPTCLNITSYGTINCDWNIVKVMNDLWLIVDLCQENNLNITCPNNFVISFDDANFGRGRSDSRCSQFWGIESIPCDNNEQTLKVLNNKCHEQQKCFLPVEKSIFGNPCTGVTKYLYVKYHCERKVNHGM